MMKMNFLQLLKKILLLDTKYTTYLALCAVAAIFYALFQYGVKDTQKDIHDTTSFSVLTRNNPTSYYENRDGEKEGFEYDLIQSFANFIGKKAIIQTGDKVNEILREINSEDTEFDVAAASLAQDDARERKSTAGPIYDQVNYIFVCNKKVSLKDASIKDLMNFNISIPQEAFFVKAMKQLGITNYIPLKDSSTEEIFQMINEQKTDCTLADERLFQTQQHLYPDFQLIQLAETKQLEKKLVWYLKKKSIIKKADLERWLKQIKESGEYDRIKDRYFGHIQDKDYYDSKILQDRIKERLPLYKKFFEEAGQKYDINWTFLAAIAYQESHWDPKAQSPTGVRGLMMLTQKTAASVGVQNRLDPRESIFGGARYLKTVMGEIPEYINNEDRLYMALASYNVGMGHLQDARALAIWQNRNPNEWTGVREALPLLSVKKHYRYLPRGYARGTEPVQYVQRIRNYHDMIKSTFKVSDSIIKNIKKKNNG